MKRYQNPDVFEPLAMAYALGTLQGRARERFKTLMSRHFYLRVVTEAYEQQFSGLVGLLPPEEPSPEVWQRLETELGLGEKTKKTSKPEASKSSWLDWFHWPAMVVASMLAAVITVVALNSSPAANAYFAQLYSPDTGSVAIAAVNKDDMQITIALADKIAMPAGKTPTLWCYSKDPDEKPIRMGDLKTLEGGELSLGIKNWEGLGHISKLAISLEPEGKLEAVEPSGQVVFSGDLMRAE